MPARLKKKYSKLSLKEPNLDTDKLPQRVPAATDSTTAGTPSTDTTNSSPPSEQPTSTMSSLTDTKNDTKGDSNGPADAALAPIGKNKKKLPDPGTGLIPGGESGEGKEADGKPKQEGSLKIHIYLDLEVEVHLTARVKGDITIGLL